MPISLMRKQKSKVTDWRYAAGNRKSDCSVHRLSEDILGLWEGN